MSRRLAKLTKPLVNRIVGHGEEAVEIIERAAASTIARLQAELDEVRAEVKANKAAHDKEIRYLKRMLRRWREYALGLSGQLRSAGLVPYDDPPAEEEC